MLQGQYIINLVAFSDLDEPYPVGLDIYGEELFWTDWKTKSIHSANKINGKGQKTLFTNNMVLNDVQVFHKDRKMGVNRCGKNNGGCSHLCLLKPQGFSCRCPIGVKLGVRTKDFFIFLMKIYTVQQK